MPVLYLGSDIGTCFLELRSPAEPVYVSEMKLMRPLKVLNLEPSEDDDALADEVLPALVYSSLVSAPRDTEGWHRPQYVFRRFVADCAKAAGFDAIRYPSTRSVRGHNLVILRGADPLSNIAIIQSIVSFDGVTITPLAVA